MFDYQNIHIAGTHKVRQLHEDAERRAAATENQEERRPHRMSKIAWTLRLLSF